MLAAIDAASNPTSSPKTRSESHQINLYLFIAKLAEIDVIISDKHIFGQAPSVGQTPLSVCVLFSVTLTCRCVFDSQAWSVFPLYEQHLTICRPSKREVRVKHRLPAWMPSWWALFPPLAAFVLQGMFWSWLRPLLWFLFYPAVFFSSWIGGRKGGLWATLLSTLLVWYFFIPPERSFSVGNPTAMLSMVVFAVMGVMFSHVHERLRKAKSAAEEALVAVSRAKEQLESRVAERTLELAESRASIQRSEARLAGIVNWAMDAIISVDADEKIVLFNTAAEVMFGCPAEKALGQPLEQFIPPPNTESGERRRHIDVFGVPSGASTMAHPLQALTAIRANGESFPTDATISQTEVDGGFFYTVILRDATSKRQAEGATALLAAIVESSADGIIGKDLKGTVTSWNLGAETIFGFTAAEMVGQSITKIIPPERIDEEEMILGRLRQGERLDHFETERRTKSGDIIPISVTVSPIVNGKGEVVGASKVARNISERRLAELALREKDEKLHETDRRLAEIVHGMSEACFALDKDWRFTFVNDRGVKLLRHSLEEMLGNCMWDVFSQLVGTPMETHYRRAMVERVAVAFETFSPVAGRWVDVRLFPTPDGLAAFLLDIQDRKDAEAALREQQERLHETDRRLAQILQGMTEACFALDNEWRLTFANSLVETLLLTPVKGILGKTFLEVFPHLPGTEVEMHYRRAMADRKPVTFEVYSTLIKLWLEVRLFPTKEGIAAFLLNIQARKEAELLLREQQEHSMALLTLSRNLERVNALGDALRVTREFLETTLGFHTAWFYLFSEDRKFIRLVTSDVVTEEVGATHDGDQVAVTGDKMLEEIAGSNDLVVVEDAPSDPRTNKDLVKKLGSRTIVNMPVVMSGRRLGSVGAGTFGNEGIRVLSKSERELFAAMASHVSVVIDRVMELDTRQRAEAALRASEARFVKAFNSNPAPMCITTMEKSRFIEVNERYCQMFGLSREQMIGRTSLELGFWVEPEARAAVIKKVQAEGFAHDCEARFRRSNGELRDALISMEVIEFAAENEPVLISMFADITERKRAEIAIQVLNTALEHRVEERTAQLEAANKELESFSYSVSHDLRAPLRAMNGYSKAVEEDYGALLPAEGQRYLRVINASTQKMGALIDDLLTFSRLSRLPLTKRKVNMRTLAQSSLDDLGDQLQGRSVEVQLGEMPECDGDPALLKQVWMNLISNAITYTRKQELAQVEIGSTNENGRTIYSVKDNGAGFDMRYANKLFGVFQRLHRAEEFPGTGVGLAIVQRIVHRHGGQIWVQAALGKGAAFYFTIDEEHSYE